MPCGQLPVSAACLKFSILGRDMFKDAPGRIIFKICTGQWRLLFLGFVRDLVEHPGAGLEVERVLKFIAVQ